MRSPHVPPDPFSKTSCKPGSAYLTQRFPHDEYSCWKCGRRLVWNGRTYRWNHVKEKKEAPR